MKIERTWTTQAGLVAIVLATPMGHRCGYVGVPEGHALHGKHYDDLDIDVHGGLTYSDNNMGPVNNDAWWFGFDCAHFDDKKDVTIMSDEYRAIYKSMLDLELENDGVVRTLEFCEHECEKLAAQLKAKEVAR